MENENKNTENLESNEEDLVSGGHAFEGGPSEKSCREVGITKKFHPFKKDEYFDTHNRPISKQEAKCVVNLNKKAEKLWKEDIF